MPLRIIRNDIKKMNTEAIVNTANDHPEVGSGCDSAIYQAAGNPLIWMSRKTVKISAISRPNMRVN